MPDYIPPREAELVTFSQNFATRTTATPTAFGLTAAQATTYAALATAFQTAFQTSQNPSTRTPTAKILKDQAKADLVANTRLLAGIVQKHPGTTNAQRSELGLTVHAAPGPVPAPSAVPQILITSTNGRTIGVRIMDSAKPTRRGKPAGCAGITVMSFVGPTAPEDPALWKFEGSTSRTKVDVVFPTSVAAGTKVWLTAFYFNARSLSGMACEPISTFIQFGGELPMAA